MLVSLLLHKKIKLLVIKSCGDKAGVHPFSWVNTRQCTYIKVLLQLSISIEAAPAPGWPHILLGAIRECMKVKALVAKGTLTFSLLEILAWLVTVGKEDTEYRA